MNTLKNEQPVRLTGLFVDSLNPAMSKIRGGMLWVVRVIEQGDRYGRGDCLVHDRPEPLVEFFDIKTEKHWDPSEPLGHFVSRYYLKTLLEHASQQTNGLLLDTGAPQWQMSGQVLNSVIEWAEQTHGLREAVKAATLQAQASALHSQEMEKMRALSQAQRQAADGAFESFDFGPDLQVVDSGGWEVSTGQDGRAHFSRPVYLSLIDDSEDADSHAGNFSVAFDAPTAIPTSITAAVDGQEIVGNPARSLLREVVSNLREFHPALRSPFFERSEGLDVLGMSIGSEKMSRFSERIADGQSQAVYEDLRDLIEAEIPYMKVIFSQSAFDADVMGDGGFWSNHMGWGNLAGATVFMKNELGESGSMLIAGTPDAVVMDLEEAYLNATSNTDAAPTPEGSSASLTFNAPSRSQPG